MYINAILTNLRGDSPSILRLLRSSSMFLGVEETLGRLLELAANPQEGCFTLWRKTRLKHMRPVSDRARAHNKHKVDKCLGP